MVAKIRERDIEEYLVARVKAMGGEVRKVKWIGRNGAPDRFVLLPSSEPLMPGRHLWVELKAPGKVPEDHQLREHDRMRRIGCAVLVIDSFAGVEEMLG
jgi:hypothetical protein